MPPTQEPLASQKGRSPELLGPFLATIDIVAEGKSREDRE